MDHVFFVDRTIEYDDGARFVFDTEADRPESLPSIAKRSEGSAVRYPIDAPEKNL